METAVRRESDVAGVAGGWGCGGAGQYVPVASVVARDVDTRIEQLFNKALSVVSECGDPPRVVGGVNASGACKVEINAECFWNVRVWTCR